MRPDSLRHLRRGSFTANLLLAIAIVALIAADAVARPAPSLATTSLSSIGSGWTVNMTAMTSAIVSGITAIPESASCLLFGTSVSVLLALRRRVTRRAE
ncbi:MAG: hypothetical protein QM736_23310 [Vicinamibacterales bacterium]